MSTKRSDEKEILDLGPEFYTPQEFVHCQKMLLRVNLIFGIFHSTVKLLKKFSATSSLLDVGCGAGLFLLHLSKKFPNMQFEGIDISNEAINMAQQELAYWKKRQKKVNVTFNLAEQSQLNRPEKSVDIVLATLVCHHISDVDLVCFLQQAHLAARKAVIINDLQRCRLAEWFYRLLSPILFQDRLITHDGLISIRRSFTRAELQQLIDQAGIADYQIKWQFPFRWSIVLWKK